jgi:hypothetical protein
MADYIDQGIEATRSRATMFRVLDTEGCLRAIPGPSHSYQVEVHDPHFPENSGEWSVTPGEVARKEGPGGVYRLTGTEFTQAFLGSPSAEEHARRTGQQLPTGLAEHLPPNQTCCMDFF